MAPIANPAAALISYDAGKPARELSWQMAESNADVERAELADKLALCSVQDAFHVDTHDLNNKDHCRQVDIAFMRRMAIGS